MPGSRHTTEGKRVVEQVTLNSEDDGQVLADALLDARAAEDYR